MHEFNIPNVTATTTSLAALAATIAATAIDELQSSSASVAVAEVAAYTNNGLLTAYESNLLLPNGVGADGEGGASNYTHLIATAATSIYGWCNQSYINHNISGSDLNCTNSTYIKTPADDISFILPWWRQVLWSILFGGMVIVATGGNLIVVWIVVSTKRMRTVTNYFIVNLSIADAMVSSLNVTFNYIYMLDNDWPFGELYCKISQFIATLSISASVFTLMAISIDRYVAIMKPLQPRMSKRCNLAIAAVIWAASIIISCPMFFFFTTGAIHTNDGIRTVCYSEWPDGSTNHSEQEYMYNIVFMILTYILPIISMTLTYSRVGIELWGSKAIGEYTPRQVENVKSKRRVVKMMMVVVLIFAVCWLPFHTYFIVTSCYPAITETPFIQEVYLLIYWLAMSNSMYNPIIYCWMNSRFRYGFKMFFRWCPFVHVGAETLNRRDNMTSRYSCSGSPDHNRIKRNDTQRSFLYACPGSPKSRRMSHYGVLRNSAIMSQRDITRYSAPIGNSSINNSYHQRCSLHHNGANGGDVGGGVGSGNIHELSAMCVSNPNTKDYIKMSAETAAARNNTLPMRQIWTPPLPPTAAALENNLIDSNTNSKAATTLTILPTSVGAATTAATTAAAAAALIS